MNESERQWSADFSVHCDGTVRYTTSEGDSKTNQIFGQCKGMIETNFPLETLEEMDVEELVDRIELNVKIYEFPVVDKPKS